MRLRLVALVVTIGLSVASCDDDDHHTTATVESVQGTKACIRPEDPEQTNLQGCLPVTTEDARRLRSGQCIEVDIPNYLVDENKDLPLKSIKVLDRRCK